jgi:hypothetical protein
MLLVDTHERLEFYFIFDDLIVVHSTDYKIVQDMYNKYYEKYGDKHTYYLYTVGKYNLKM